jgi:thioredoxin-like negative regulator of GroEL
VDSSLVPLVRPEVELCQDEDLGRILEVVLEMYEDLDAVIDTSSVLTALGEHPARKRVASLAEHASHAASPKELLEGGLENLRRRRARRREEELRRRFLELETSIEEAVDGTAREHARSDQERVLAELEELLRSERTPQNPSPGEHSIEPATHSARLRQA